MHLTKRDPDLQELSTSHKNAPLSTLEAFVSDKLEYTPPFSKTDVIAQLTRTTLPNNVNTKLSFVPT